MNEAQTLDPRTSRASTLVLKQFIIFYLFHSLSSYVLFDYLLQCGELWRGFFPKKDTTLVVKNAPLFFGY